MYQTATNTSAPLPAALTFDVDWAPDWAIDDVTTLLRKHATPATFMVTHQSPVLEDLRRDKDLELGIHPNFLQNSDHGDTYAEVLDACLELVPDASSVRTHCLYNSSILMQFIGREYPQIEIDSSVYLPDNANIFPASIEIGRSGRKITCLPFAFADAGFANRPDFSWSEDIGPFQGIEIYTFHPMNLALNMNEPTRFSALKEHLGERRLWTTTREEAARFRADGDGAWTYLESLLKSKRISAFATLTGLLEQWRSRKEDQSLESK
ncbi:MAG: hypothetical protein KAH11_02020 [Rhodospirillales bacterium]|jgi:hypothetical protein|nr:hypothetical protein [Rhodospirillales bacterium]